MASATLPISEKCVSGATAGSTTARLTRASTKGVSFVGSARDRNNRQIDGEALGIGVEQKPRAHGEPVAAVARHDGGDEQSGGASVAG